MYQRFEGMKESCATFIHFFIKSFFRNLHQKNSVFPMLYGHLMMVVRGFDEDMQLEMAEDLVSFASEHIAHTTGVISADFTLDVCYLMIAYDHNILKKGVRSKMNNIKGSI